MIFDERLIETLTDVFISHVEEDGDIALGIALKLEEAGYRTWSYEVDSIPGPSYLLQTGAAIEQSRVVVLVISANSLGSRQVTREVVRAHESGVDFIPVLRDISHVEFQNRQPEWREALGSATSITIPKEGISPLYDRILDGLKALGLTPVSKPDSARLERIRHAYRETLSGITTKPGAVSDSVPVDWQITSADSLRNVKRKALFGRRKNVVWAITAVCVIAAALWAGLYFRMNGGAEEAGKSPPALTVALQGSFSTSREVNGIFVIGNTAYLANSGDGLLIVDISNPSDPERIGEYMPEIAECNVRDIVVFDGMAYVTVQGGLKDNRAVKDRLLFFDVGIPSNPIKVGEYQHDSHRELDKVSVAGDIVFLPVNDSLQLIEISEPSNPVKVGAFNFDSNVAYPDVALANDVACLMANDFHVIDIRDSTNPIQIGQYDTSDWGSCVALDGEIAYVVTWSGGLEIIDISVPTNPVKLGRYKGEGNYELLPPGAKGRYTMMDAFIAGDIAYLTYNFGIDQGTWVELVDSGFIAIDVSDPANPEKIAEHSGMEDVSDIFVADDLLFVTDTKRGLFVYSIKGQ